MDPRTVFITGASSGIGEAVAREMARRGWNVGVLARREAELQALVETLRQRYPSQSFAWAAADVMDEPALFTALEALIAQLGSPQVFIANSGVGKGMSPLRPMWQNTRRIFLTNILGSVAGLEYIKDHWLREQRTGRLVGVSSVAAARGLPGAAAYSASKAALATYLESVRGELSRAGIGVTCIHPGFVRTPLTATNPWMPWLQDVDAAGRRIAEAIERGDNRYIFPFPMRIVYWLLRHMPDRLYDRLSPGAPSYKKID